MHGPHVLASRDAGHVRTRCGLGLTLRVNYLCTCIAINLMLCVSFGLNPLRAKLERWYIGVSLGLGLGITIIPTALGHFGPDPVYGPGSCYFSAMDPKQRLIDFSLDLYLWQGLATLVACVSITVTLSTLLRQGRATAALMPLASDDTEEIGASCGSKLTSSKIRWCSVARTSTGPRLHTLQDKFINIAMRIALYPITLVIVNTVLTVGDMYLSSTGGVNTAAEYGLFVVYYALYGGRGLFFALVNACSSV